MKPSTSVLVFIVFVLFLLLLWHSHHHPRVQRMVEMFSTNDPLLDELKDQLKNLRPEFNNVELYEGNKSYTLNKKKVFVCMKDNKGRYYNRNMLVYVILHEYSHLLCDEIDDVSHGAKFHSIFQQVLKEASAHGLYDPSIPPLTEYCGHS